MRKIFAGLLFLGFDFHLNLDEISLNLMPAFVGALLILYGIRELNDESPALSSMKLLLKISACIFMATWVCSWFSGGGFPVLLIIVNVVLTVTILYRLTAGVRELEQIRQRDLHSSVLKKAWWVYLFGRAGALVFAVFSLIFCAAYIVYLVYFYKAGTIYSSGECPIVEEEN